MKKSITFSFRGKKYSISDYSICDTVLSKTRGLMFRSANYKKPLLFVWKNPGKYSIHSFFCRDFLAVWLLGDKIIEVKFVKPWKFSVTPKGKFNSLLEIPAKFL
jgi:uncharacterized membrane protein (UPF0127 family)